MKIYDVLVIGAGPVGLATAIGLRKRGIDNILVIDQTRDFRQIGQGVDLLPNGLKALKYLDLNAYEAVNEAGNRFLKSHLSKEQKIAEKTTPEQKLKKTAPEWVQRNFQGEQIRSISLSFDDWWQKYGEGRVSIGWYDLQTTLRNLLPQEQVQANHRCINLVEEPENGWVRIDCVSNTTVETNLYAHWQDRQNSKSKLSQDSESIPQQWETKSFRAKLVIAADGINSTARRILYNNSPFQASAKPEYSGFVAVGGREITDISNDILTALEETFLQSSPVVTIRNDEPSETSGCWQEPSIMVFRRVPNQLGYIVHAAVPLHLLEEKSGHSLIDLVVQELDKFGFPHVLKELIRCSPPEKMFQRPYYIHRATLDKSLQFPSSAHLNENYSVDVEKQPAWHIGRIVLAGDAAHGMPPFMAQGANQGLEDAMTIATLIANISDKNYWNNLQIISEVFDKYEQNRRPFMAYIQQATLTRFKVSEKASQEYSQTVYCRDFEQILSSFAV